MDRDTSRGAAGIGAEHTAGPRMRWSRGLASHGLSAGVAASASVLRMEHDRRPTAILSLQGGLGNQLFQWSAATALAADGVDVRFDTVRCRGDRPLAITALLGGARRLPRSVGYSLAAAERWGMLGRLGLPSLVTEHGPRFDADLRDRLSHRSYLLGYFQSPRYFDSVADTVRHRIVADLRARLTDAGDARLTELQRIDAVAVHVRRGDYVSNPTAAAHHGTTSVDYYRAALELASSHGLSHRIWFSDDLPWVRANLAEPGDSFCEPGLTTDAGGEIALMAGCRGRVIANSSFSWWAAWLGAQPDEGGLIVAPRQWFAGSSEPDADLIPTTWTQIPEPS